ncbi:hypothetical protein [Flindersiella endophytica]
MNGIDEDLDLEGLLENYGLDEDDFGEAARRRPASLRTPARQSSFVPRQAPTAASQGQVQQAARSLDSKIETLSNAVKALESRTNTIAVEQDKIGTTVRKEMLTRKKGTDGIRAELQQTKMLLILLPLLTQQTVEATDDSGKTVNVVTQSSNQLSLLLPLLLLMPGGYGGSSGSGQAGGMDTTMLLLLVLLLGQNK